MHGAVLLNRGEFYLWVRINGPTEVCGNVVVCLTDCLIRKRRGSSEDSQDETFRLQALTFPEDLNYLLLPGSQHSKAQAIQEVSEEYCLHG